MTETDDPVDFCIRSGLDDIDLIAMDLRLDLLLRTGADAVHAGTEGVSGGFNIASPTSGFRAMVFVHSDSVSLHARHSGGVRASAAFQMPADDMLKQALERGGEGIVLFVERWRRILASTPTHHASGLKEDSGIAEADRRASAMLDAIISASNPDFPPWNAITVTHRTSVGGGSIVSGGKPILTAEAERAVLDALPRIVDVKALDHERGYGILSRDAKHRFTRLDGVAVLRTLGQSSLTLPQRTLRKAGMEKRA